MATNAKHLAEVRAKKGRDFSPKWEGHETWDTNQFLRQFHSAMAWYRLESSAKELKPKVIDWMGRQGCTKEDISAFKKTKDNRCGMTMGAVAACLIKGMPSVRDEFNDGRDTAVWLRARINEVIEQGRDDLDDSDEVVEVKKDVYVPSIQERVREVSLGMTEEIEAAIEAFQTDPETFDPKAFKVLNLLKAKQAKAAHARIIRDFYARDLTELLELASGKADEQLKEGYSHRSKKQIKSFIAFLQEIESACNMLMQEAKVNKKPRAKKAVDKDKIIAKLKYKKSDEPLKLVSINPADIIGAQELWIFNSKTRKLGKYVAAEFQELGIKGTTITGFSETKSVQKTLRKPAEQIKAFKEAGKVVLRKFLEDINAVDTKMNGRINEEIMLLKVQ
jgi:molybdopterin converting factor small subunit